MPVSVWFAVEDNADWDSPGEMRMEEDNHEVSEVVFVSEDDAPR